jgi:hypothetical protein
MLNNAANLSFWEPRRRRISQGVEQLLAYVILLLRNSDKRVKLILETNKSFCDKRGDSRMRLTQESKSNVLQRFRVHPTDTGSPDVQIALLSERITHLN